MGLLGRVKERDTGIGDCTIMDAAGVPYAAMPSILYAGELEVLIDELIEILHDQAAQAAQAGVGDRFGDSITTLEPDDDGVNVSFQHAPPQRFNLVIGADGAHSTVRRLIFGPEEDFTHYLGCYYGYRTVDNRLGLDHEGMATGDGETAALSVFSVKHNRQARAGLLFKADQPRAFVDRVRAVSSRPVIYAELPGAHHDFDLFESIRSTAVSQAVEQFTTSLGCPSGRRAA